MKLQTRIILISCIAVVVATTLSDTAIWTIYSKNYYKDLVLSSYYSISEETISIEQKRSIGNVAENDINAMRYIIKQRNNDLLLCFHQTDKGEYEEVFNHTDFTYNQLRSLKYNNYTYDMRYTAFNYSNKKYLLCNEIRGAYEYFLFVDITASIHKIYMLAVFMILSSLVVAIMVVLVLNIIIKKYFEPLSQLSVSAQAIAQGDYAKRIENNNDDEIGRLASNFNQMAESVEKHTKSLEEEDYKKTLFMGNLTHELKTPMTAISGYAQTLLMTKLEPEDEEEALSYIYEECGRLERLSQKMMKLLELGQDTELDIKKHKAYELFTATAESTSVLLKEKGILLDIIEHGEELEVDIDLMTDVLINLVDNSYKASSEGAHISLVAGMDENNMTFITVKDSGRGIPEEDLEKITEPFYMVDKSRSRKQGGAGLGLALCKLILKHHNMDMRIKSTVGVGTEITIYNLFTK